MPKIPKIIISIILIVAITLNPFSSIFEVRASASVAATIFAYCFVSLCVSVIAGCLYNIAVTGTEMFSEWWSTDFVPQLRTFVNYVRTSEDVVLVDAWETGTGVRIGNCYVNPDCGLSGNDLVVAQAIADGINEHIANGADRDLILQYNSFTGRYECTAYTYERLKEIVVNSLLAEGYRQFSENITEVADVIDAPTYNYDFVGPKPTMTFPLNGTLNQTALVVDGFILTPPFKNTSLNENGRFATKEGAELAALGLSNVNISGNSTNGFAFTANLEAYGGGAYVVYNGKIYYQTSWAYTADSHTRMVTSTAPAYLVAKNFIAADGTCLDNTDFNRDSCSFMFGWVMNRTGEVAAATPSDVDEDDFYTGGGTAELTVARTPEEELIGNALAVGLITPDSTLQLDEDGTITGADGVSLEKIEELLEMISDGSLKFEDIQEYLDLMTQLIASGNVTSKEQEVLLGNIATWSKTLAGDISAIKSAITSATATSEITAKTDFDIDTPDVIIDKFPFCLPFDVYKIFNLLSAAPSAPSFDIPFKLEGVFDYTVSVDLSEYEFIAVIVRWFIYIIFVIGLILVTNKLIGRG